MEILYADRRDRRKSPGVPGAVIAIFADRRDQRIKSPNIRQLCPFPRFSTVVPANRK